jgi:hypothetical protein
MGVLSRYLKEVAAMIAGVAADFRTRNIANTSLQRAATSSCLMTREGVVNDRTGVRVDM